MKNVASIIYIYLIYQSFWMLTLSYHHFSLPLNTDSFILQELRMTLSPSCTLTQTLSLCTWLPHCLGTFYTLFGGRRPLQKSPLYFTWVSVSPARLLPVLKLSLLCLGSAPHQAGFLCAEFLFILLDLILCTVLPAAFLPHSYSKILDSLSSSVDSLLSLLMF